MRIKKWFSPYVLHRRLGARAKMTREVRATRDLFSRSRGPCTLPREIACSPDT